MGEARIIVNPIAGNEKGLIYAGQLASRLAQDFALVSLVKTAVGEGAAPPARQAAEAGVEALFVIGGDGTVNEAIEGLVQAQVDQLPVFGVIPSGTFNGVSRILNFPPRPQDAIRRLDLKRTEPLDIGLCNRRAFSFIFSIGDIPESIHNVSAADKASFGMWAYLSSVVRTSTKNNSYQLDLDIDGKKVSGLYSHLVILLSATLNNLNIVGVEAAKDDGWFHIFLLKESNFWEKFSVLKDLLLSNAAEHRQVEYYRGKQVRISSPDDLVETDVEGERGDDLPVELKVLPSYLTAYTLAKKRGDQPGLEKKG